MAIIPAEYYGLFGLGQQLGQAGQLLNERGEKQKQEKLQELQLMAQLNPNQRQAMIQMAVSQGLLPQEALQAYAPTSGELKEDILTTGLQGGPLDPTGQNIFNQFQGLEAGDTLGGATRRFDAQTRAAELQVDEMTEAQNRRTQYEQAINTPAMRKMLGLPEDQQINAGTIEAYKMYQGINQENLVSALRSAQTDTERAQLSLVRAQTNRVNAEIAAMKAVGADEASADWLKNISLRTGHMPSMIQQAFDPKSTINSQLRTQIVKDVNDYQNSLRADWQKTIREGTAGQTGKTLNDLVQMHKNGIQVFEANDPIWMEMTTAALNESGLPAFLIPGEEGGWFGIGGRDPQLLTGAEAEAAKTAFERAAETVGSAAQPGKAPTIDAAAADQYATQLVQTQGGVEAALKFVNENKAIEEGDRNLLRNAITKLGQTETPAATPPTTSTPAPTPTSLGPRAAPVQLDPVTGASIADLKKELATKTTQLENLRKSTSGDGGVRIGLSTVPGTAAVSRSLEIRNLAQEINRLRSQIMLRERTEGAVPK